MSIISQRSARFAHIEEPSLPCHAVGAAAYEEKRMDAKIIRLPQVKEMVGLGTTKVYEMIKNGEFPKQVKLGRASGWIESEIKAWIDERARQRG